MISRIHFGYFVVAALALINFASISLGLSCAGIFYSALSVHLDVGAGTLGYYTSLLWTSSLVATPLLSRLLDRVDARLCVGGAVAIVACDFLWLSFTNSLWHFLAGALVMGPCVAMLLLLAPPILINRWFAKRTGLLIGIVMAFNGIGGMIWNSVGGALIESAGWSLTYQVFAFIAILALPPSLLLISDNPRKKGLDRWGSDGGGFNRGGSLDSVSPAADQRKPNAAAIIVLAVVCFSLNFNMHVYFMLPSYIGSSAAGALAPLLGTTAASIVMVGQTISKVLLGCVGDRFPYAGTAAGAACGVLGVTLFIFGLGSSAIVCLGALMYGFYYGVATVMAPILTRRAFGEAHFPKIYPRVSMAATLAAATAGFIWGFLIELTGSYMVMLAGVGVLLLLTIVLIFLLPRMSGMSSTGDPERSRCQTG